MLNRQVLGGEYDVPRLLALARDTFGAASAELVTEEPAGVAGLGRRSRPGPAAGWCSRGAELGARERSVAAAFASHVGVLREREELARQSMAAQQLEAGNRTRTALLAAVSHDLRTPLAGLRSAAETLRVHDTRLDEAERQELLDAMESSIARLTGDGQRPARHEPARDRCRAADRRRRTARRGRTPRAGRRSRRPSASWSASCRRRTSTPGCSSGSSPTWSPTPCATATRSMVEGSPRRGAGRAAGRRPRPGVEPADRARIFEPFQRQGDTGTGVGLGLAVARGLTEAQGGTLEAESTPGGGLTMVLELPGAGRMKVLLVDDDTTLRADAGIGLRAEGHDVLIAADGRTALAGAARGPARHRRARPRPAGPVRHGGAAAAPWLEHHAGRRAVGPRRVDREGRRRSTSARTTT